MTTVEPILLKVEEAAKLLRIGRSKAYEWIADGVMPGVVRINGGPIRINYDVLRQAMKDETLRQAAEEHAERERLRQKLGLAKSKRIA